jgi:hypothetical protein
MHGACMKDIRDTHGVLVFEFKVKGFLEIV